MSLPQGQVAPRSRLAAPVQTTYNETMIPGYPGMPATMTGWDCESLINESECLLFGAPAFVGTRDDCVKNQTDAGATPFLRGVAYRDITLMAAPCADCEGYALGETAGIMSRGDIWVAISEAVTAKDPVHFKADGTWGKAGGTAIQNAQWSRGGTGAAAPNTGLAILRLNFPHTTAAV